MQYESTRGGLKSIKSAEAIKRGLAPDGGLFVPEDRIEMTLDDINEMINMSYQDRAVCILRKYLTDYSDQEIADCVYSAYTTQKFGDSSIAPVYRLNENVHILELWHGPTCAFKDMALQILPHFLVKAVKKTSSSASNTASKLKLKKPAPQTKAGNKPVEKKTVKTDKKPGKK